MGITDARGFPLSGATAAAADHYDRGIAAFNLVYGDALAAFDLAVEDAPAFVMARLAKAWIFALATDPGATRAARAIAGSIEDLPMNDWEQGHFVALLTQLEGAPERASRLLNEHLVRYPFDILAHECGFLLDLFLGQSRGLRDRPARALGLWPRDMPGYPTLLAFHSFGLEETGEYARAEAEARESAEREPYGFWAHHTVAHVMEMQGRPQDGIGWMIAREPLWSTPDHVTQTHVWWHRALFHIELGQFDAALALYDGPITATRRPLGVNLTNASALLWRLHLLGCDVSDRWRELAPVWAGHADGRASVFCDLHAGLAGLGAGQDAPLRERHAAMLATAASSAEAAGTYRDVGVPLLEAFIAFARGDYPVAAEALMNLRHQVWRIGGSHAQRDLVDWTLTEAALRGGLTDLARALTQERLAQRPHSFINRAFLKRAQPIG